MDPVREGTVLGERYRLEHPLGRGSMGRVWHGRDLHLGRPVAVKTVITDAAVLADSRELDRLQQRFAREARAAATLDSSNVATVYDADITGDLRWLVMQLVEGRRSVPSWASGNGSTWPPPPPWWRRSARALPQRMPRASSTGISNRRT